MSGKLRKLNATPTPEEDEEPETLEPETPEPEEPETPAASAEPAITIDKPKKGASISKFKIKNFEPGGTLVETVITALPCFKIADARDWVRVSPLPHHLSEVVAAINVPIIGQKRDTLHLIMPDLISQLDRNDIQYMRLILASKPYDRFCLIQMPAQNLDNVWNRNALAACTMAKAKWVRAVSKKKDGEDGYRIIITKKESDGRGSPFPLPKWPKEDIDALIEITFEGRTIDTPEHPAWRYLVGDDQIIS
jgi:hypothetical protein